MRNSTFFKKVLILSILIFISIHSIMGQKPYSYAFADPLLDKYRWRHFKELSGRNFTCFAEDRNGTMWFGIEKGLMSYDGYEWKEYMIPEEKQGNDHLRSMVFSGDTLFIGGDNGIQTFVNGEWSDLKFKIKPNQRFTDMYVEGSFLFWDLKMSNGIILGASIHGLYIRKNGQDHFYANQEVVKRRDTIFRNIKFHTLSNFGEELGYFFSNILDCGNNTFFGFFSRIDKNPKTYFIFKLTDNNNNPIEIIEENTKGKIEAGGPIASLLRPNGEVWVVSEGYNSNLSMLRNSKWEHFSFKKYFNDTELCWNILNLCDNSVLITSFGVLYRFYNGQWTKIKNPEMPFKNKHIIAKFTKSQDLWMGDEKGEVYKIDYNSKHWTTYKNLSYQFTNTDSSLWFISDDNKVVIKKGDEWNYYDQTDGLPLYPLSLYRTKKGTIWCGGSNKQVAATAYLKNNKWIMQVYSSLSWGVNCNTVTEDKNGDIWFAGEPDPKGDLGQLGGAIKIHQGIDKIEITHLFNKRRPFYYSFAFGEKNDFYAGTSIGLLSVKNNQISTLGNNQLDTIGLLRTICNRIIITNSGSLLVATKGKGIVKYIGRNETTFNNEGLNTNVIYNMYVENENSLWVATNEGYSYYNGQYWFNNIFPREFDIEIENGILSGDANNIWISKFPLQWARRAYNMLNVLASKDDFFSSMYKRDSIPPDTKITFYFSKVASTGNTNIEWTGIDFMNHTIKEKILYSYRLNNEKWSIPSSKTNINLTDLNPGVYDFEVKAFDTDTNEDPSPSKIQFTVMPMVWQQVWFLLMIVTFIIIIIYMNIRIILRNKKLALLNQNLKQANDNIIKNKEEILQRNEKIMQINKVIYEQKNKIEKSLNNLHILSEFGKQITSLLDTQSFNKMIFEYLPSLMNTTALGIGFYNKNKNCLEFDNFIERGIEIPSFSLDLDDSISLSVMCFKNREIIMRNDLSEEYKAFLENQKDNHFKELPYSMIHVPLILLEQPIGVIVVNSNKKNAYTEDDVINLQTLASYLSIAIDNAKAYGIIENNNTQIIKQNEEYQKLNEELFIAKEKAEESDRLKTAFLQNLSHEIRTPMNAIYGFSERLSKPNLTEEKRLSYISIIQSSSNNLLSIVTDILTISSIVTKQEKINISKVCINKVIGDILPEFHKTALNKNITLNVNMELSDMESEIFTDSVKITYILKNLISNALKFSETGMIVVGYILKKDSDIDVIEFFVKDNGIGIKPELQKKIFEPFRQGDVSKQSEYGGTGLGLSIAKGFVELLGGKIWVQSEYTKGSTFYFTIPYKLAINIA